MYCLRRIDEIEGWGVCGVILYIKESIQAYEITLKIKQIVRKKFGVKYIQRT